MTIRVSPSCGLPTRPAFDFVDSPDTALPPTAPRLQSSRYALAPPQCAACGAAIAAAREASVLSRGLDCRLLFDGKAREWQRRPTTDPSFFFSWNVKRHRGLVWRQGAIHNSTERFLAADGFDDVIDTTHEAEVWADSQTAANAVAGTPKL